MSEPDTAARSLTDRGFITYDEFKDSYRADVKVVESSAASGPHVWVFVKGGSVHDNEGSAHLSLDQAVRLRDALTAFIREVPERWEDENGRRCARSADDWLAVVGTILLIVIGTLSILIGLLV